MRRYRSAFGLIACLALAGCGSDTIVEPDPDPMVSGSWSGQTGDLTLDLTLTEGSGGSVSGNGVIADSQSNIAVIVRAGTHVYPNLSLTLGSTGYTDFNFTGQLVSATLIAGSLSGGTVSSLDINLTKN